MSSKQNKRDVVRDVETGVAHRLDSTKGDEVLTAKTADGGFSVESRRPMPSKPPSGSGVASTTSAGSSGRPATSSADSYPRRRSRAARDLVVLDDQPDAAVAEADQVLDEPLWRRLRCRRRPRSLSIPVTVRSISTNGTPNLVRRARWGFERFAHGGRSRLPSTPVRDQLFDHVPLEREVGPGVAEDDAVGGSPRDLLGLRGR